MQKVDSGTTALRLLAAAAILAGGLFSLLSPLRAADYTNEELVEAGFYNNAIYQSLYHMVLAVGGTAQKPVTYLMTDGYELTAPESSNQMPGIFVGGYSGIATSYNVFTMTESAMFPYGGVYVGMTAGSNHNAVIIKGNVRGQGSIMGASSSPWSENTAYFGGAFNSVGTNGGSYNTLIISEGAKYLGRMLDVGTTGASNYNRVEITGAGSEMQMNEGISIGASSKSATGSNNSLIVSDGGKLVNSSNNGASLQIGYPNSTASDNYVLVTGQGSEAVLHNVQVYGNNQFIVTDSGKAFVGGVESGPDYSRYFTVNGGHVLVSEEGSLTVNKLTGTNGATVKVTSGGLLEITDTLTLTASLLQLDGGYVAWAGDQTSAFESLIAGGRVQLLGEDGNWLTETDLSKYSLVYVTLTEADTSTLTGGLHADLGGCTILSLASAAVPEPAAYTAFAGSLLLAYTFLRRHRARTGFTGANSGNREQKSPDHRHMNLRRLSVILLFFLTSLLLAEDYETLTNEEIGGSSMNDNDYRYLLTGDYTKDATGLDVYVGNYASNIVLTIEQGAKLISKDAGIGMLSSDNSVTVTGEGSAWTASGKLYVGKKVTGNTLTISAGGLVSATYGYIGSQWLRLEGEEQAANGNAITVTGAGSLLAIQSALTVGDAGSGNTLTVETGGSVTSGTGIIGNQPEGGRNVAKVSGAGASWAVRSDLTVGYFGSGNSLIVSEGGKVTSKTGYIGRNLGSSGNSVSIGGGGSSWIVATKLYVGYKGFNNDLFITDGGKVTSASGCIGNNSEGFTTTGNTVSISGVGSTWETGTLAIYGGNTLTVEGGGLLIITSSASDALSIASDGWLRLDDGYLAWAGDQTLIFANLIESGHVQLLEGGSWVTAASTDLFSITAAASGSDTSGLTGGLYSDLGGYTILGLADAALNLSFVSFRISGFSLDSLSTVPEPVTCVILIGTSALALAIWRRKRRQCEA